MPAGTGRLTFPEPGAFLAAFRQRRAQDALAQAAMEDMVRQSMAQGTPAPALAPDGTLALDPSLLTR